jgi:catechol 2,3-dioxygenase-like lactoylglutathione lyase family enzyme
MRKIFVLLLLLTISLKAFCQNENPFEVKFNHIALSVKDVNKSADFYKNVLNLNEITNRTKMDGIRWFSLGDGKELHLVSVIKEPVTLNKAVHFALSTSNFEAFLKNVQTMKITYSDWPGEINKVTLRADGIKQIYLQDVDGNWIEINSVEQ